jgi:hypothetical protein
MARGSEHTVATAPALTDTKYEKGGATVNFLSFLMLGSSPAVALISYSYCLP